MENGCEDKLKRQRPEMASEEESSDVLSDFELFDSEVQGTSEVGPKQGKKL